VSIPFLPIGAIIIIAFALVFDFLNGMHDSSNIVATLISSRAMGPRRALLMTALAEVVGPFLFGVAVATTIGHEIVGEAASTPPVILAALVAAISWNIFTWLLGIPSSSSHTLIGGIIGATLADSGMQAIMLSGLEKVLIALFISPLLGFIAGYLIVKLIYGLALISGASPRANWWLRNGQTITALTLALSHGTNDAQKTMGIITLGLVATGVLDTFHVPLWVIAASAAAIALGTYTGGWRLIKTGCLGGGHPGRRAVGWTGQHDTGGEFGNHGGRWRGTNFKGTLGRGRRDHSRLAADHSCFGVGRRARVYAHQLSAVALGRDQRSCPC
jgi:PiT family inorganic phosphate transporter